MLGKNDMDLVEQYYGKYKDGKSKRGNCMDDWGETLRTDDGKKSRKQLFIEGRTHRT